MEPSSPSRSTGASSSMNNDRKAMVVRATIVVMTARDRLAPNDRAGLPRLLAYCFSFGAFFCTHVSRCRRWRVWASQPWPFWTWSTMVGRRSATRVSEFTSGYPNRASRPAKARTATANTTPTAAPRRNRWRCRAATAGLRTRAMNAAMSTQRMTSRRRPRRR